MEKASLERRDLERKERNENYEFKSQKYTWQYASFNTIIFSKIF